MVLWDCASHDGMILLLLLFDFPPKRALRCCPCPHAHVSWCRISIIPLHVFLFCFPFPEQERSHSLCRCMGTKLSLLLLVMGLGGSPVLGGWWENKSAVTVKCLYHYNSVINQVEAVELRPGSPFFLFPARFPGFCFSMRHLALDPRT